MIAKENFIWKEHKVNNIETNPLEEWYCIIDLGDGRAKKYSIKPQYPSVDGIRIDRDKEPEYYIFFESNGLLASEEKKKDFFYNACNFDEYLFDNETLIRVFTTMEEAKERAYYNYTHIFIFALGFLDTDPKEITDRHFVVK